MDGSDGENLAVTLKENLDNHAGTNKVLAYVLLWRQQSGEMS